MPAVRVVADTNVLVSGLLWPGPPAHFLDAAVRREFHLLTSEELPPLLAFLSQNVCGAHEVLLLFCWNC